MGSKIRPLTAEFVGTFALVFASAGSVVVDAARGNPLGLLGIALAPAMTLAVFIPSFYAASGAHFNPAVTFGMWLTNRIDGKAAGMYVVVQLIAAAAAAFFVKMFLPSIAGEIMDYGNTRLTGDVDFVKGIVLEAVLTFILLCAIFGTLVSKDAPKYIGGFAVGAAVLVNLLIGAPLTGAAMNPARAFGPALISMEWTAHAVFWIGPVLGAAVAALLWDKVLLGKTD
ncbi:MAG: aquaporin [Gemmatimonadota bacterium]|nr:aquaporin [Gemmatimonadota bacterium]